MICDTKLSFITMFGTYTLSPTLGRGFNNALGLKYEMLLAFGAEASKYDACVRHVPQMKCLLESSFISRGVCPINTSFFFFLIMVESTILTSSEGRTTA